MDSYLKSSGDLYQWPKPSKVFSSHYFSLGPTGLSIDYVVRRRFPALRAGLITTRLQEKLYQRAHIANIKTGVADPKENETVALMEVIFSQNIFADKTTFIVNSQQPPVTTSRRRCDIVISYLDTSWDISTLCFAECKRASTHKPYSLKALEEQAMEYCAEHLQNYTDKSFIYAATMAGAHIRLWRYQRGDTRLQQLWGSNAIGDWSQYKDVGQEQDGRELEWHFGKMKGTPPTARADQGDSYGDSFSTATLSSSTVTAGSFIPPSYQAGGSGWGSSDLATDMVMGGYETPNTFYQQPKFSYTPVLAQSSYSEGPSSQQPATPAILRSSQPSLSADAIEVFVKYKVVQHKRKADEYFYRFEYGGEPREVAYHEWRGETVLKDGEVYSVFAYTGKKSGLTFWTPTLDIGSLTEHQSHRGR